ncbi:MAG: hypothetical protein PVJ09_04190 [Candidatus Woesebacteria bacterium]|jgi:hypothetical protein
MKKRIKLPTINLSRRELCLFFLIFLLGLTLRLYPGRDHYIWFYDQARDRAVIQSIIEDKNLVLLGPATSKWGLFHGPLFYYFLAPFYFLSQGDTFLAIWAMILFNLSAMIPLALLTFALFKNKKIVYLSLFFFAISYEMIEYARWLTNVSMAIPFLLWAFYFAYRIRPDLSEREIISYFLGKSKLLPQSIANLVQQKKTVLLPICFAISLGLAIQSEIFLIYLIPFFLLYFFLIHLSLRKILLSALTLILTLSPLVLAEFKFSFQMSKSFFQQLLQTGAETRFFVKESLLKYFERLALSAQLNLFGLPLTMSFFILLVTFTAVVYFMRRESDRNKKTLYFLFFFLFSQIVLFIFPFVDRIYLNLTVGMLLIILAAYFLNKLMQSKFAALAKLILLLFFLLQIFQLRSNTLGKTPFSKYESTSPAYIMSSYFAVLDKIYEEAEGEKFSIAVLANPYGVRTTWAGIFQIYFNRKSLANEDPPTWFGYHANGYWEDDYFPTLDYPQDLHFLIIYPQSDGFLPAPILEEFFEQQDDATLKISEYNIDEIMVEKRIRKAEIDK